MKKLLLSLLISPAISHAQTTISLVQDIEPGIIGSTPRALTVHNGQLYMFAGTPGNRELYKYDGSACTMVQDFNPSGDIDQCCFGDMLSVNGSLYLNGSDGIHGMEMLKYDGTSITALSDIYPGAGSANPTGFTAMGNKIYFSATDTVQSEELWGYDLLSGITAIVHNEPNSNSMPGGFTIFNSKLYFNAFDVFAGHELRSYDPATNNYDLVQDLNPGFPDGRPIAMQVVNNKLYLVAKSDTYGRELYSYSGTGTLTNLTDLNAGAADGIPNTSNLYFYQDAFYFTGNNGSGDSLYRFNIQNNTVSLVYDKAGRDFIEYGGKLYFTAEYPPYGKELCVYDGANVSMIEDLNPGAAGSDILYKTIYNNELYFMAVTATTGAELYKLTDSTLLTRELIEKQDNDIMLFPNPASKEVTVVATAPINNLEVYNITGQLLLSKVSLNKQLTVDISTLPEGIYLMKINGSHIRKFVRQ